MEQRSSNFGIWRDNTKGIALRDGTGCADLGRYPVRLCSLIQVVLGPGAAALYYESVRRVSVKGRQYGRRILVAIAFAE